MDSEARLLDGLNAFGLERKESNLYVVLLKFGSKTVAELTHFVKSYREDVYRTVKALVDKGLVKESIDKPLKYAAITPVDALDVLIGKQLYHLEWMEKTKESLAELSAQIKFQNSHENTTFRMLRGRKDVYAVTQKLIKSAQQEIVLASSRQEFQRLMLFGLLNELNHAALDGVSVKYVTEFAPFSKSLMNPVIKYIDVRHCDGYCGLQFLVVDSSTSLTTIKIKEDSFSINTNEHVAFLNDDRTYARTLMNVFDISWRNAEDISTPTSHSTRRMAPAGVAKNPDESTDKLWKAINNVESNLLWILSPQLISYDFLKACYQKARSGAEVKLLFLVEAQHFELFDQISKIVEIRCMRNACPLLLVTDKEACITEFYENINHQVLYTNNKRTVDEFKNLFYQMWNHSIGYEERKQELLELKERQEILKT